jgi:hypothetical protein
MENDKPEPPLIHRLVEDFWWVMPIVLVLGTVVQCQKKSEDYAYERGKEDAYWEMVDEQEDQKRQQQRQRSRGW